MRKTTVTIVGLFFLSLFLINASRQKKDTNQIKEENIYGEMSRILFQDKPEKDFSLPEIFLPRNLSVKRMDVSQAVK